MHFIKYLFGIIKKKVPDCSFNDRELLMSLTDFNPFNVEKQDKSKAKSLHGMC